jgi:uncharacterized coiled-coil protein SlyX
MRFVGHGILLSLSLVGAASAGLAQEAASPAPSNVTDPRNAQLEKKIEALSEALATTQQQIEQSQRQMQQLQQQLLEVRQELSSDGTVTATAAGTSASTEPRLPSAAVSTESSDATDERHQVLESAVKILDQTKVESSSKYPVHLTGLVLFNGYLNKGVADDADLPTFALAKTSTSGNGNLGASLRQTILGIEGFGPRIGGAHTSANVNLDFFSAISYNSYGTSAGIVRMRTASIDFDWLKDSIEVGIVSPLISPLAPASYATVAEPSLAGAGNLWTWAPQLRYAHRFPLEEGKRIQFEFGLWDAPSAGYNPNELFRVASPAELSEQPSYETRISYGAPSDRGLQIGASGYYSRQDYPGYQGYNGTEHLDSWAGATDWRLPLNQHFEISGEGYRGRSLAGLGGGLYKDVVTGTSPVTGANVLHGLNAIGGWAQFKTRYTSTLETNISIGEDDGFARDFHAVILPPTAGATLLRARNKMMVANLIFRPKTYIILSPEYRRIWSSPINGPTNTLDIFSLTAGYQF